MWVHITITDLFFLLLCFDLKFKPQVAKTNFPLMFPLYFIDINY